MERSWWRFFVKKKLACVLLLIYFFIPTVFAVENRANDNLSITQAMKERLINFVTHTIDNLKYTSYKFGGNHFDASKGVYVLDCSAYVDNILESIHPDAYFDIADKLGTDRLTSHDYYTYFRSLANSNDSSASWSVIKRVEELEAGDILVFRYKNKKGRITGGHVMVVMDTPIGDADTYSVKVADSAPAKHSQDTRAKKSGIGIGTLSLKVNPTTGQPYAFAWSEGARWRKNVNFAMARPVVAS